MHIVNVYFYQIASKVMWYCKILVIIIDEMQNFTSGLEIFD
jgi:hypothetical protein